jgi:hypothetical protein
MAAVVVTLVASLFDRSKGRWTTPREQAHRRQSTAGSARRLSWRVAVHWRACEPLPMHDPRPSEPNSSHRGHLVSHALDSGYFDTLHAEKRSVAIARVEAQAMWRKEPGMTADAMGREDRVLNALKVGLTAPRWRLDEQGRRKAWCDHPKCSNTPGARERIPGTHSRGARVRACAFVRAKIWPGAVAQAHSASAPRPIQPRGAWRALTRSR